MTMKIAGDRPPRYGTIETRGLSYGGIAGIETGRALLQGHRWLGIRPQSRTCVLTIPPKCAIFSARGGTTIFEVIILCFGAWLTGVSKAGFGGGIGLAAARGLER